MKKIILLLTALCILFYGVPVLADTVVLPHRVIDVRAHTVIDFEGLLARLAEADVVTLGENHDDPATHRMELAILEGLFRVHGDVVLSMEMFERDVQPLLDSYLAGEIEDEDLIASGRMWGNYETDYAPMVEFCRDNGLPVVASNIPRQLARRIAETGYELTEFSDEEKEFIASTFQAPEDGYWEAFAATMMMPGMEAMHVSEDTLRYFYEAQVIKDETMAESVSNAHMEHPGAVVYHIAGAFHLADYLGTFSRIERNIPQADCVSIHVLPVDDLLAPPPDDAPKADYWILVLAPEEEGAEVMENEGAIPVMPPMPSPAESNEESDQVTE